MGVKNPTAHWPVPSLLRSLSRAGWGELTGREFHGVRCALRGLSDLLDDRSGTGLATAYQLAETTGYSERWVRACLVTLEDMGVIEWSRGGIRQGKPQPSFIKIVKSRLVELIRSARASVEERRRIHAEKTAERLRTVNPFTNIGGVRRSKVKAHAEVSASPRPPHGGTLQGVPPVEDDLFTIHARVLANHARSKEKERAERRAAAQAHNKALAEFSSRTGLTGEMAIRALLAERWTGKKK